MDTASVVTYADVSNPKSELTARAILGQALRLAIVLSLAVAAALRGSSQTAPAISPAAIQIADAVRDPMGMPIAGAHIRDRTGKLLGTTDAAGTATFPCPSPCTVIVEALGFTARTVLWQAGTPVILSPASVQEQVSVTAYRMPLGDLESPASTRVLSARDLHQAAGVTLDGQLRLVPGVETFRRSSSLVANPSSQGLSLRGLGSTSASRTLVTEDDVPLNDAFGGWIHWEELPELSIRSVEVVRGGASDLYGSSAIGGVVNILPPRPSTDLVELNSNFASLNTYDESLLLEGRRGHWGGMATGGVLGTDGFIQLAPAVRGAVDEPSNVHAQNGLLLIDRETAHAQGPLRLFLRASAMNEARDNGTPLTQNATRLWRSATGADWSLPGIDHNASTLTFRAYGSTTHYRQTFSTVAATRAFETRNRFAKTPDDEMGLVLHWSQPIGPHFVLLAGSDSHDVRAGDYETVIAKSGAVSYVDLTDRQRQTGAYAEALFTRQSWTVGASARLDWFSNFDGNQLDPTHNALPGLNERVFDPRLGISRKLGQHFAVSGTGFRAYRAPTPNELYRSTQVGSLLTYPNHNLSSERATGWETGIAMEQRWGTLRTSYFWTQVNHPITALTIDAQASPIQLMRENLGQIESRGVSVDLQMQPTRWMTLTTGYQHTNATVTKAIENFTAAEVTPTAVPGDWIPQVAHNMATAQLRGYRQRFGTLSLQGKLSGKQYDDDANTYLLHGYFKLDAYASHEFGKRIELYTSGENLLNRQIDVGRTPLLSLATPRTARVGFRLKLGPSAN